MTRETMTVHKALSEKKLLVDRIEKLLETSIFCAANKHSSTKIDGVTVKAFSEGIKSSYDKITDLMKRCEAIDKAITNSNANTVVNINGEEYSVAVAIWMKNHGIEFLKSLRDKMMEQYRNAQNLIHLKNDVRLEERADKYVTELYSSKDGTTDSSVIEQARQTFIEANSYDMVDPIDILKKVAVLDDKISSFLSEVDSALSVSNALTSITIEY